MRRHGAGLAAHMDVVGVQNAFSIHLVMFLMEETEAALLLSLPWDAHERLLQCALLFLASQTCPHGYLSANGCPSSYLHCISIAPAVPFSGSEAVSPPWLLGVAADLVRALLLDLGNAAGSDPCFAITCLGNLGIL